MLSKISIRGLLQSSIFSVLHPKSPMRLSASPIYLTRSYFTSLIDLFEKDPSSYRYCKEKEPGNLSRKEQEWRAGAVRIGGRDFGINFEIATGKIFTPDSLSKFTRELDQREYARPGSYLAEDANKILTLLGGEFEDGLLHDKINRKWPYYLRAFYLLAQWDVFKDSRYTYDIDAVQFEKLKKRAGGCLSNFEAICREYINKHRTNPEMLKICEDIAIFWLHVSDYSFKEVARKLNRDPLQLESVWQSYLKTEPFKSVEYGFFPITVVNMLNPIPPDYEWMPKKLAEQEQLKLLAHLESIAPLVKQAFEPIKPEELLEDRTLTDPYGPGAIVVYKTR